MVLATIGHLNAGPGDFALELELGPSHTRVSPDGQSLLLSGENQNGLFLVSLTDNRTLKIADGIGVAYQANWSTDGRYIAFKQLTPTDNGFLQTPGLFDVQKKQIIDLLAPAKQVGIPNFSQTDKLAVTIGQVLYITNTAGTVINSFELPAYSNQTPISPDGNYVIFTDNRDQLWLLDPGNDARIQLTNDPAGYFEPIWSPGSQCIVASSIDGILTIFNIVTGARKLIGMGRNPAWTPDGNHVVFSRTEYLENRAVVTTDLYAIRHDGTNLHKITNTDTREIFPTISVDGTTIFYTDATSGKLYSGHLQEKGLSLRLAKVAELPINPETLKSSVLETEKFHPRQDVNGPYFNIPYLHQAYDTPDWFNGNWACGGTSAVMCLAYYRILAKWPITVRYPYSHTSHFGSYVAEIYTYNGYSYNIGGYDPNGTLAYGAYGFIIRNNWRDTKGYMAQYARQHGLNSGVDWNPSRSKAMQEVSNEMPFVLLNSLTSSGHYISVIGYEQEGTTLIVNDPWGDKNQGYSNYQGRRARYDWPGYNNGYSNLNTVHCFIYFQGTPPGPSADLVPEFLSCPDTFTVNTTSQLSARIINQDHGDSQPTVLNVLFYNNSYFDTPLTSASTPVPMIAADDSLVTEISFTMPDSLPGGRIYYAAILADAEDTEFEMDEANNFYARRVIVLGYPEITKFTPLDSAIVTVNQPEISAKFRDAVAKIDTALVRLWLDQTEVTSASTITDNSITYNPQQPLSDGWHLVTLQVGNRLGYLSKITRNFMVDTFSKVVRDMAGAPGPYQLFQNYPNPFNTNTRITFSPAQNGLINLGVYSLDGKLVKVLENGYRSSGSHSIVWDGTDGAGQPVAAGIYFARLKTAVNQRVIRMILLK